MIIPLPDSPNSCPGTGPSRLSAPPPENRGKLWLGEKNWIAKLLSLRLGRRARKTNGAEHGNSVRDPQKMESPPALFGSAAADLVGGYGGCGSRLRRLYVATQPNGHLSFGHISANR